MKTLKKGKIKYTKFTIVLIIIVLILISFILFNFVIKSKIDNYILNKQLEAKDATLNSILMQINQRGYAQITDTQGNVINLAPVQLVE